MQILKLMERLYILLESEGSFQDVDILESYHGSLRSVFKSQWTALQRRVFLLVRRGLMTNKMQMLGASNETYTCSSIHGLFIKWVTSAALGHQLHIHM